MRRKWDNVEWKQLPSGEQINVPLGEEIAIVSVVFVDERERPRDFPLALNGRVISHVEINSVRFNHVGTCKNVSGVPLKFKCSKCSDSWSKPNGYEFGFCPSCGRKVVD